MNFNEFLQALSNINNIPLPSEDSQLKMAPPNRRELLKNSKKDYEFAKQAGVLALFYPDAHNKTRFALILRKAYDGVHSAQVAFPGGQKDLEDESLKHTALRETFEEIGVQEHTIEIVKTLSHVYIPPSNFYVQPYMGITQITPKFVKQEQEVDAVLEIFLSDLLDERLVVNKTLNTSYGVDVEVPAFKLNGFVVWGATAMVLSEIKDLLKQLL